MSNSEDIHPSIVEYKEIVAIHKRLITEAIVFYAARKQFWHKLLHQQAWHPTLIPDGIVATPSSFGFLPSDQAQGTLASNLIGKGDEKTEQERKWFIVNSEGQWACVYPLNELGDWCNVASNKTFRHELFQKYFTLQDDVYLNDRGATGDCMFACIAYALSTFLRDDSITAKTMRIAASDQLTAKSLEEILSDAKKVEMTTGLPKGHYSPTTFLKRSTDGNWTLQQELEAFRKLMTTLGHTYWGDSHTLQLLLKTPLFRELGIGIVTFAWIRIGNEWKINMVPMLHKDRTTDWMICLWWVGLNHYQLLGARLVPYGNIYGVLSNRRHLCSPRILEFIEASK